MLKNNVGYEHFLYGSFQFYNLLTFFQYTLACLPKKLQFELQTVFPIRNLETEKPIVIFAIVFLNLFFLVGIANTVLRMLIIYLCLYNVFSCNI